MTHAKIIAAFGVLAVTAVLENGFPIGESSAEGAEPLANPWGIDSMVDLDGQKRFLGMKSILDSREQNIPSSR